MKQYIDKDAVEAKIKKIYNEDYKFLPSDLVESVQDFKDDLLIALDTLEVKKVNLIKEMSHYLNKHNLKIRDGGRIVFSNGDTPNLLCNFRDITKHFFELGLFSTLTWQDIRLIAEIGNDFMNSEESDSIELTDEAYYGAILAKVMEKVREEGRDAKTSWSENRKARGE